MNHYNILTQSSIPSLPRIFGGVGSFFAISGFLMFSSYEKHHQLRGYLVRRAKRILPPYVFIVVLAAVGLSVFSSYGMVDYFTNPGLYKYLICNLLFLNFLEPSLPGVFDGPEFCMSAVNGSLWTMKGEVICYLSVPLVFNLIKKHPEKVSAILGAFMTLCFVMYMWLSAGMSQQQAWVPVVAKQFRVFTFFFAGAMINVHLKEFVRHKWIVFAFILGMMAVAEANEILYMALRPFSDSLLVIWCSVVGSWGVFLSRYNSLSYNIYLFHFPIIQILLGTGTIAMVGAFPGLLIAIVLSVGLAAFSWHVVDSPILSGRFPGRLALRSHS